jgi:hypothetical protein
MVERACCRFLQAILFAPNFAALPGSDNPRDKLEATLGSEDELNQWRIEIFDEGYVGDQEDW